MTQVEKNVMERQTISRTTPNIFNDTKTLLKVGRVKTLKKPESEESLLGNDLVYEVFG